MATRINAGSMITRDAFGNQIAPTGLKLKKSPKKGLLSKPRDNGMGIDAGSRTYGGTAMTDAINRTSGLKEKEKPESTKYRMSFNNAMLGGDNSGKDGSPQTSESTDMDAINILSGAGKDIVSAIGSDKLKNLGSNIASKVVGRSASATGFGTGIAGSAGTGSTTAQTIASTRASTGLTAAAKGSAGTAGTAKAVGGGLKSALTSPAAINAIGTAGIGVVAEAGKAFGNTKIRNKKEDAGYSLRGASKGANIGGAIGSFIPVPGGTFIGAGIGAGIGAITGAVVGKKKMKERKKQEKLDEVERKAYNTKIKGIKRREIGKGADIDSYKRLLGAAGQYSNGGKIRFKKGGILKYSYLNVKESISYLDSLVEPEEKAPSKIFRLKKGGSVKLKPLKKTNKVTKMYKRGGGMSKSGGGCGCSSCMKSAKHGGTPKFRRGGKLDVAKQNVILDGPSHDQKNNTGVAGDKGLPIVKNGEKVAEIESNELVLNAEAVKKIDVLKTRINSGDDGAKEELAELLHKELGENTYDYNKKL